VPDITIATTAADGRAAWVFAQAHQVPPVITALPVDPAPADDTTVIVTLEEATAERVTVRVWRTRALLGLGLLPTIPAGAGIQVHLTAVPAPLPPDDGEVS
jgi:hypothetical protein